MSAGRLGDGGPQAGEVTRLGGVTRLSLSNYNERRYDHGQIVSSNYVIFVIYTKTEAKEIITTCRCNSFKYVIRKP